MKGQYEMLVLVCKIEEMKGQYEMLVLVCKIQEMKGQYEMLVLVCKIQKMKGQHEMLVLVCKIQKMKGQYEMLVLVCKIQKMKGQYEVLVLVCKIQKMKGQYEVLLLVCKIQKMKGQYEVLVLLCKIQKMKGQYEVLVLLCKIQKMKGQYEVLVLLCKIQKMKGQYEVLLARAEERVPRLPSVCGLCNARYQQLQTEYVELGTTVQEQKSLISQLEDDLRNVNALSSMFRGEGEGVESVTPGAEMVASAVKEVSTAAMTPQSPDGSKSAADSLLPIVQSQRERYRVRAQELEAQTIGQQQQITMLQNEIDKLRSDNVKLYEKVRYLQSAGYSTKAAGHHDDGTLTKYSTQYEERLDPFSSFSRKERIKRYMNLKPYDKITLSMCFTDYSTGKANK
ncbi:uncharacterized protein LOC128547513 [Mercenaria mercenaria]|uniref:uncharacterized protein LOC128547513 n=1 Tax=Mercenaria mercenaria TaxID=6596 RepID=UPI00234EF617|nr:uncharacterized protein LOC128547513 [Mercenaria mercenaria]